MALDCILEVEQVEGAAGDLVADDASWVVEPHAKVVHTDTSQVEQSPDTCLVWVVDAEGEESS